MANKIRVALTEPLEVGGQQITEVEVRHSTIGDEEDAMQEAVQLKRGRNPLTVEMCLLSRVSKLPYDIIRSMHGPDYAAIRAAHNELNGLTGDRQADDGENPMTPKVA